MKSYELDISKTPKKNYLNDLYYERKNISHYSTIPNSLSEGHCLFSFKKVLQSFKDSQMDSFIVQAKLEAKEKFHMKPINHDLIEDMSNIIQ